MTNKDDYQAILDRSWDDIPEPKVLPKGSWLLRGKNISLFPPKSDDQSLRVACFYTPIEPMEDVDPKELEALGDDYAYSENDIVKQFFINRNKDWHQVRKHLELHGINGKTQKESFEAFKGSEIVAYLGTKTYVNSAGQQVTDNDPVSFAALT